MTNRPVLIAANWKMNGDLALLETMLSTIVSASAVSDSVEALICPPFTLLGALGTDLNIQSQVSVGSQNVSQYDSGAHTGEISTQMLQAVGCEYVIVGHSERREMYSETNEIVAEKFVQIARSGIKPILCLGESLEHRESDVTEQILEQQIAAVVKISEANDWNNAVIAYEPVWAIGTGKTATPEVAQETHAFIRENLRSHSATQNVAEKIRILYGGSMKPSNAADLLAQADIDGGLVGGASLDPDSFISILKAAS